MVGYVLGLDRAEGPQTHVEGHIADTDTYIADGLKQFLGKMQPSCGRGGGANLPGIDRLISFCVLKLLLDIRRQRHFAQALKKLKENTLIRKLDQTVSALQHVGDLSLQFSVPKGDPGTCPKFFSRPDQTLPGLFSPINEQDHLAGPAPGLPLSDQAGGQDSGVVEDKTISWPKKARQIIKMMMTGLPGRLIQGQKTGTVPPLDGSLRDELRREIIIKIVCFDDNQSLSLQTTGPSPPLPCCIE